MNTFITSSRDAQKKANDPRLKTTALHITDFSVLFTILRFISDSTWVIVSAIVKKVIFFSVLQEAMKPNLKQKPHPYEVYNKRYKII